MEPAKEATLTSKKHRGVLILLIASITMAILFIGPVKSSTYAHAECCGVAIRSSPPGFQVGIKNYRWLFLYELTVSLEIHSTSAAHQHISPFGKSPPDFVKRSLSHLGIKNPVIIHLNRDQMIMYGIQY